MLLSLLNAINDLKRLPRTGWLLMGVAPAESVADHGYATALLALLLAEQINAEATAQGAPLLDVGRVLHIALLHDLAESLLTDLPHRATALLGEAAKHAAEREAFAQLTTDLPQAGEWQALWEEYRSGATPEAQVVRDADKLELAHQALRYAESGRRGLGEFVGPRSFHSTHAALLHAEIAAAFAQVEGPR